MSQTAYSASYLFLRVNKTPICNLHTSIWNIEMFVLIGNDLCEVFLSVVLFVFKKLIHRQGHCKTKRRIWSTVEIP